MNLQRLHSTPCKSTNISSITKSMRICFYTLVKKVIPNIQKLFISKNCLCEFYHNKEGKICKKSKKPGYENSTMYIQR